jgi:hypothetical protein
MEHTFKENLDFLLNIFSTEVSPDQPKIDQEKCVAEEMERVLPLDVIWMFGEF